MWPIFFIAEKCRHKTLCSPYDCSSSFWYQAHFEFITIFMTTFVPDWHHPWWIIPCQGIVSTFGGRDESRHDVWKFSSFCRTKLLTFGPPRRCKIMSSHSMLLSMALKATYRWNGIEVVGFRVLLAMFTRNRQGEQKWWQKLAMNQQLVGSPESPKSPCSLELEWHEHAWTAS